MLALLFIALLRASAEEADDIDAAFPAMAGQLAAAGEEGEVTLTASKARYKATDQIVIEFSGLPGNEHDWITLVKADQSDGTYGEWFFTGGEESGTHAFAAVPAGDYEVRVYFDWPAGGYEVKKRIKIAVK